MRHKNALVGFDVAPFHLFGARTMEQIFPSFDLLDAPGELFRFACDRALDRGVIPGITIHWVFFGELRILSQRLKLLPII